MLRIVQICLLGLTQSYVDPVLEAPHPVRSKEERCFRVSVGMLSAVIDPHLASILGLMKCRQYYTVCQYLCSDCKYKNKPEKFIRPYSTGPATT